jgi:V/A-type H+-transporting ATPase subunit D
VLLPGGASLATTANAYRRALVAAVEHAAAEAAVNRIETELARTRRRLRSLDVRAIPGLLAAIKALELRLDETDREDLVRTKWATDVAAAQSPHREAP